MEASEVQDVCRLCPETGATQPLLNVFDRKFAEKNNMKEVILITTGIEISESDIISKKICQKCYKNTRIITQIRQTAMRQDQNLKEKCRMYLSDKGLRLANTRIIIKKKDQPQENQRPQPTSSELFDMLLKSSNINMKVVYRKKCLDINKGVHPSIIDIYKNNPKLKLPKKCLHIDVAPTVSLAMEEVETYFKKRKLDIFKYIYRPSTSGPRARQVARKRTAVRFKAVKDVVNPAPVNELKESILKDWDDVEDDLVKVSHVVTLNSEPTKNDESAACSSNSTSKPAFIESLGLTPSMSLARFPRILMCKICHSVQNNIAALKKHHSRHRVCEYCKVKLKSVEKKNNHVVQCEVKKILESPEPFVQLEKVDSNLDVRKRYRDCFAEFSSIEGLDEAASSKVIVIADEEETAGCNNDVIEVESNTAVTLVAPTSTSVVKPVIGICNDTVLEQLKLTGSTSDQIVVRDIANVISKLCKVEIGLQTEARNHPPVIKDGNCTLKNFKSNLLSYSVPVKIAKGDFNVSYISTETHQKNEKSGMWNNLQLVEKRIRTPPKPELSLMNTTYPLTFVQSSQLAVSSIQLMTTTPTMSIFLPNHSAILQGAGLALQPNQTINNAIFNPLGNASIQTTPLLQNYTLSMAPLPVINNPPSTSTEKTNPNVAASNTGGSGESKNEASSSSRSRGVSKKETSRKSRSKRPFIKVKIGKMSKSARRSKLRVKNIWELK